MASISGSYGGDVEKFNNYVKTNGEIGDKPFVSKHNGHSIAYYLKFNVDSTIVKRIRNMFLEEFSCKTCSDRAVYLSPLLGKGGLLFCKNIPSAERTDTQKDARAIIVKSFANTNTKGACGVVLVPFNLNTPINIKMGSPYSIRAGSVNENPDWFHHYSNPLNKSSKSHNLPLIQLALNHYMQNIWDLLMKFHNSEGLMESLAILYNIIGDIAYASQYKGPISWLYNIMNKIEIKDSTKFADLDYVDKMNIVVTSILAGPINNKGLRGEMEPFLPFYNSCTGIVMNWLVNGRSEKDLRQLIKENCSPQNYKRSSGEVTEGVVKNAMKILGADTPEGEANLYTKVHTVREIEGLGAARIVPKREALSSGSFASGLRDIATKATKQKKDPCGLASRIARQQLGGQSRSENGWDGMTIRNLYDMAKSGKIHSLEIKPGTGTNRGVDYAFTAKTGIDKELLSVPHLWGFTGKKTHSTHKVSHIYLIESGKYKVGMFILPRLQASSIIESKITGNCMFPEFFKPNCQRELRKVVEKLNKKNKVGMDKYQHNSFGIGVNIKDDKNSLFSSISVKINGGVGWVGINMFC